MKKNSLEVIEPPHSKESEMMVLGCMLSKINDLRIGSESLQLEDFYIDSHKIIFRTLKQLFKKDKPADIHLVFEELKKTNELDQVGGVAYLTTLAQFAGTSAYVEEYIKLVKDKSILRKIIFFCQDVQKEALKSPHDTYSFITRASNKFESIERDYPLNSTLSIGQVILGLGDPNEKQYLEKIAQRKAYYSEHKKPFPVGIPTNFSRLDDESFILRPGNLIIIAGRPAMGKTAFGLNIMHNICSQGLGVSLMSLEMGCDQILERLISLYTGIPAINLESGNISTFEDNLLKERVPVLIKKSIYISDTGVSNINQLTAEARTLYEEKKIKVLIVDYLQLLGASQKKDQRHYEVAEISTSLKKLAMELQIPVVCLAQLSRKADEKRRPVLSDLKDSGQIEQDADVVCFLHRPGYYNPKDFDPKETEIIIAKNRHGKTFTLKFNFNLALGSFTEQQAHSEEF